MFNTTMADQDFTMPDSFVPLLDPGEPTVIHIYKSAPKLDGTASGRPGEVYFVATIQAEIKIGFITLTGFLQISLGSGSGLIVTGAVGTEISFLGALSGTINLVVDGQGVAGRVYLALAANRIPGLQIDGEFLLEINTSNQIRHIETFGIDPATGRFVRNADGTLHVQPVDLAAGPSFKLVLRGKFIIAEVIEIRGEFTFDLNPNGLKIDVDGTLSLLHFGEVEVHGHFVANAEGIVLQVRLSLAASFGGDIGLKFNANAVFEINTTGHNVDFDTPLDPNAPTVQPGVHIFIGGGVEFLGFVEATGSVDIRISNIGVRLEFHVHIEIGGLEFSVDGLGAVYVDNHPGLVLMLQVTVDADAGILEIQGSGLFKLNTTGIARDGIDPGFVLDIHGQISILKILNFDAGVKVVVGDHFWSFQINADISFFGIASLHGRGYIDSNGNFDISLSGRMVIGSDSFGLVGDFEVHITSIVSIVNDRSYYRFDLGGSAHVRARLFGITIAGLGLGFNFHAEGQGRVPVTLEVEVEIDLGLFSISKTGRFQIGVLQLPQDPIFAGDLNNPAIWSGGQLVLNTGARAA